MQHGALDGRVQALQVSQQLLVAAHGLPAVPAMCKQPRKHAARHHRKRLAVGQGHVDKRVCGLVWVQPHQHPRPGQQGRRGRDLPKVVGELCLHVLQPYVLQICPERLPQPCAQALQPPGIQRYAPLNPRAGHRPLCVLPTASRQTAAALQPLARGPGPCPLQQQAGGVCRQLQGAGVDHSARYAAHDTQLVGQLAVPPRHIQHPPCAQVIVAVCGHQPVGQQPGTVALCRAGLVLLLVFAHTHRALSPGPACWPALPACWRPVPAAAGRPVLHHHAPGLQLPAQPVGCGIVARSPQPRPLPHQPCNLGLPHAKGGHAAGWLCEDVRRAGAR
eukprot:comp23895_c0_seq2/m.42006 comp23895_c0_seq2/g.42006  ORF comp23895_c0_seq2/g.42006 comp23895_c0_seq2/m.42006 type:complete len:332 (+) comp23895_c0_seq2:470-1465(+)